MSEFQVEFRSRNINSKQILKEIRQVASDVCNEYISNRGYDIEQVYDYDDLVAFLDMYFSDLMQRNVITQYDLIGDHRNNTVAEIREGNINIHVKFRQLYCVNVSSVEMKFSLAKRGKNS